MVNEALADLLLESYKQRTGDKSANPEELRWSFRKAPFNVDFPYSVTKIETLHTLAITAPMCCGDEKTGLHLQALEMRFYQQFLDGVAGMGSEGGAMIKIVQTQTSEHSQKWDGQEKTKGIGNFLNSGQPPKPNPQR